MPDRRRRWCSPPTACRPRSAARPPRATACSVIDATCPLVAKVHHEARRFAAQGQRIVLVGHGDHEEVIGTMGEAPGGIHLVEGTDDVERLTFAGRRARRLPDPDHARHRRDGRGRRGAAGPVPGHRRAHRRRHLLRHPEPPGRGARAGRTTATSSSWSARPTRPTPPAWSRWRGARAAGPSSSRTPAGSGWAGCSAHTRSGSRAGASTPDVLVQEVVEALGTLGPVGVEERRTTQETVHFALPQQVR